MVHLVRRRAVLAGWLAVGIGATNACAGPTTAGQATTALTAALEQAGSAVETSHLIVTQLDRQRLTQAIADTSLLDQIHVLEESSNALATLVPPAHLGAARTAALTAVGAASAAVVAARAWIAGEAAEDAPQTADTVLESLEAAGDQIDVALAEAES